MAIEIKHATQATGTDAGNGEVRKNQWNEAHSIAMSGSRLLGNAQIANGAAEEISIGAGLQFNPATRTLSNSAVGTYVFNTVAAMLADTSAAQGEGSSWSAAGFRYVEAASGATDHHLTTAGGVKLYVTEYNPLCFGAVGDDSTNDATEMLAWANAIIADATDASPITAIVPRGYTFLTGTTIPIGSNVTFTGGGTIAPHSSLPATSLLMASSTLTAGAGNFANKNVHFDGIVLDGKDRAIAEASTTQNLLRIYSTDGASITNCIIKNHRRGLVVFMGCRNYRVTGNHFDLWGFTAPDGTTGDGGSAVFSGKNYVDNTEGHTGVISNNTFANGRWTAISVYTNDMDVSDNVIRDGMECGIFIRRDAGGGTTKRISCTGNVISSIRENYIDAAGIVFSAEDSVCENNTINDVDAFAISMGKAKNSLVKGNMIQNAVRLNASYPVGGGITLRSTDDVDKPVGVHIIGNTVRDNAGTRIAPRGIAIYHVGSTPAALTDIVVTGNNVALSCASGGDTVYFETALRGNFCQVGDNTGGLIRVGTQAEQIIYRQSGTVDFPALSAGAAAVIDVTVPSAILAANDLVTIGMPTTGFANQLAIKAFVKDASTISIHAANFTAGVIDAASATCTFKVSR